VILRTETIVLCCAFALYSFLSKRSHAFNACTNGISTTDELSFFENIEPCICNKNGSIWYTHVEIDGVSVLTHDRNILNPFSERFNKRYLVNAMDCSIVRDDILSTIHNHFDNHSKDHYVRKRVVPINYYSEIAGVKESKLNVCKICFNHCALNYINQHLKKEHGVRRNFQQHVFRTTGYANPNQKCGFSYLYREKEDTKPPTSMTTIEGPHTHLRHEDKFLRTINANLYYGKGYPQYLHSENKEESIPVFEV